MPGCSPISPGAPTALPMTHEREHENLAWRLSSFQSGTTSTTAFLLPGCCVGSRGKSRAVPWTPFPANPFPGSPFRRMPPKPRCVGLASSRRTDFGQPSEVTHGPGTRADRPDNVRAGATDALEAGRGFGRTRAAFGRGVGGDGSGLPRRGEPGAAPRIAETRDLDRFGRCRGDTAAGTVHAADPVERRLPLPLGWQGPARRHQSLFVRSRRSGAGGFARSRDLPADQPRHLRAYDLSARGTAGFRRDRARGAKRFRREGVHGWF